MIYYIYVNMYKKEKELIGKSNKNTNAPSMSHIAFGKFFFDNCTMLYKPMAM